MAQTHDRRREIIELELEIRCADASAVVCSRDFDPWHATFRECHRVRPKGQAGIFRQRPLDPLADGSQPFLGYNCPDTRALDAEACHQWFTERPRHCTRPR